MHVCTEWLLVLYVVLTVTYNYPGFLFISDVRHIPYQKNYSSYRNSTDSTEVILFIRLVEIAKLWPHFPLNQACLALLHYSGPSSALTGLDVALTSPDVRC